MHYGLIVVHAAPALHPQAPSDDRCSEAAKDAAVICIAGTRAAGEPVLPRPAEAALVAEFALALLRRRFDPAFDRTFVVEFALPSRHDPEPTGSGLRAASGSSGA